LPDFYHCAVCKKKAATLFFNPLKNYFVCEKCYNNDKNFYRLDTALLSKIKEINNCSFNTVTGISLDKKENEIIKHLFHTIITNYITKELNSYKIVYSMLDKML